MAWLPVMMVGGIAAIVGMGEYEINRNHKHEMEKKRLALEAEKIASRERIARMNCGDLQHQLKECSADPRDASCGDALAMHRALGCGGKM